MSQPNPSLTTDNTVTTDSTGSTATTDTGSGIGRSGDSARTDRRRVGGMWRRTARMAGGMVLVLLGLLWTLQGADVVRIRPILCVADCRPVVGGSTAWLAIGVVTVMAGLWVVGVRRRRR